MQEWAIQISSILFLVSVLFHLQILFVTSLYCFYVHAHSLNMKRAYKRGVLGRASSLKFFFYPVRLDGPLPGKNDNMAAMTLAVGVTCREIYS